MSQVVTASQSILNPHLLVSQEFPHAGESFVTLHDEFQRIRNSIFIPGTVTLNFPVEVEDINQAFRVCDELAEEVENLRERLWKEFDDKLLPTKEKLEAHARSAKLESLEFSPEARELINLRGLNFFIRITTRNLEGLYAYSEVTEFFSQLLSEKSLPLPTGIIKTISTHIESCKKANLAIKGDILNLFDELCKSYEDKEQAIYKALVNGETLAPFVKNRKNMSQGIIRIALVFKQLGMTEEPYQTMIEEATNLEGAISYALLLNTKIGNLLEKIESHRGEKYIEKRKKIQVRLSEHISQALEKTFKPEEIFGIFKKHLKRSLNQNSEFICRELETDVENASLNFSNTKTFLRDISSLIRTFTGVIAEQSQIEELVTDLESIVLKTEMQIAARVSATPKEEPA